MNPRERLWQQKWFQLSKVAKNNLQRFLILNLNKEFLSTFNTPVALSLSFIIKFRLEQLTAAREYSSWYEDTPANVLMPNTSWIFKKD